MGNALLDTRDALRSWRLVSTPPASGGENMRYDVEMLNSVERGESTPVIRFFRFSHPTVSYGRLQKWNDVASLVPHGWASVQRPTGGGIVFHEQDLCISLAWRAGTGPLPHRPQEQYRWIHSAVLEALSPGSSVRMAACGDVAKPEEPFAVRSCFQNPVGFDLLRNREKILGGALRCTRRATLYQGSLQMTLSEMAILRLRTVFSNRLNAAS